MVKHENKYVIYDDYAEIIMFSDTYGEFKTKIDLEDIDKCKQHHWGIRKCYNQRYECYYVGSQGNLLHRYLVDVPKDMMIDHINRDKLDNRKSNLRICNNLDNSKNNKIYESNTSGYTGVCWNKKVNKWMAYIMIEQKHITIGYFEDIDKAVEARSKKEIEIFGEFSRISNISSL